MKSTDLGKPGLCLSGLFLFLGGKNQFSLTSGLLSEIFVNSPLNADNSLYERKSCSDGGKLLIRP